MGRTAQANVYLLIAVDSMTCPSKSVVVATRREFDLLAISEEGLLAV